MAVITCLGPFRSKTKTAKTAMYPDRLCTAWRGNLAPLLPMCTEIKTLAFLMVWLGCACQVPRVKGMTFFRGWLFHALLCHTLWALLGTSPLQTNVPRNCCGVWEVLVSTEISTTLYTHHHSLQSDWHAHGRGLIFFLRKNSF